MALLCSEKNDGVWYLKDRKTNRFILSSLSCLHAVKISNAAHPKEGTSLKHVKFKVTVFYTTNATKTIPSNCSCLKMQYCAFTRSEASQSLE